MKLTETILKDCFIVEPRLFSDERGIFFESYSKADFESSLGKTVNFVQDNHSISKKGVLRGLHFQKGIYAQAKLVRVVKGSVLDVVVDLREGSPTFKQYIKLILSEENRKMLFIPKGMAHGFLSLSEETIFTYKCDNYYNKSAESGIRYNDPDLQIDWGFPDKDFIISQKDLELPFSKTFL